VNFRYFDFRATAGKIVSVSTKRHTPLSEIARIYGLTKQGAAYLIKAHGFSAVTNPRWLLVQLLEGRSSPLRTRLSDPAFLAAAQHSMDTAPFRMAVRPRASRKPKSLSQH
jgi:hypothetical protein